MHRPLLFALVVSLLSGLATIPAAQRTSERTPGSLGHIHGVIRDATGAALPDVEVTLTGPSSFRRVTLSDANGEFWFRDLGAGRYTAAARLAGFTTVKVSTVVAVGFTRDLSFVLQPAALEEPAVITGKNAKPYAPPPQSTIASSAAGALRDGAGRYDRFNTEAYDKIDDNGWFEAARKPLSTFSTDVDTASYANVRRFLNHGQIPPKDAVRLEELINYFSYDYTEPRHGQPFGVTTTIGDCPWNSRHRLALIGLQARRIDASHLPPRNLVFLIDVSGS